MKKFKAKFAFGFRMLPRGSVATSKGTVGDATRGEARRSAMKRYARFRSPGWLLSSYSSASGCFICRSGRVGLVAWPRTATRRYGNCEDGSPRHEQEVKENVLARPAADARQLPSLSLSPCFSFHPPRQSPFIHRCSVRSLRHAPLDSSYIPPRSNFPSRASSRADRVSVQPHQSAILSFLSLSLSLSLYRQFTSYTEKLCNVRFALKLFYDL